ncbi:competence/damage-inducible protein A [Nitrosophilus kaiyonis]|uniref:competence/damage-inducible protein A n=1 Tax=Nitrosophilus kaiyonis TaxID=2930200 RepID=UPI0024924F49|nr:molybdopterin-binding protein [Nitrosophilus kaiyonis]
MSIKNPNFYLVIIGTEILNGRREDKHFKFVRDELLKRGWELTATFIINDNPSLIEKTFRLIKDDPKSVMFSFGGIGATPDDLTREIAAKVFRNSQMEENSKAKELIIEQFKEKAYPYRINMAKLPKNAKLLPNPVNKVPGFYLDERYFFVPGFPQMSHFMIKYALDKYYPKNSEKYRYTICVEASENDLMDIMKKIPKDVEFSSLPSIEEGQYKDVISIASYSNDEAKNWIEFFIKEVEKKGFKYKKGKNCI